MHNLFSNAVKYTAIGEKIHYQWSDNTKIFSITNNGTEINPEQLHYFFNRFYKNRLIQKRFNFRRRTRPSYYKKFAGLQHNIITGRSLLFLFSFTSLYQLM